MSEWGSVNQLQTPNPEYNISSVIRQSFFLTKQSQKSRSALKDRSRSLGLFRAGKTHIIAKLNRTYYLLSV